jgi:hypothetical protein
MLQPKGSENSSESSQGQYTVKFEDVETFSQKIFSLSSVIIFFAKKLANHQRKGGPHTIKISGRYNFYGGYKCNI